MNISQNTKGNNNSSIINVFASCDSIDLLPQDIITLLDYLSNMPDVQDLSFDFNVPNLSQKNEKNGIDNDYYEYMKDDFSSFQDIEEILQNDADDTVKRKYWNAKKLLQQQYLSYDNKNMKVFITKVMAKHKNDTSCSDDKSIKLQKLLHYMYANCHIGIKP